MDIAAHPCAWLVRQPPPLRAAILAAARPVTLERGQWLQSEGDEESGLCIVETGALRLEMAVGAERDVLIGIVLPGTVFGQSQRHGGGPRIVTARAARRSRVLLLPDSALARVAAEHPGLWMAVSEAVYLQLDTIVRLVAELLVLPPRERVLARLAALAEDGVARVSQADLAEMCGLSRKAVNAHLAALERGSVLARGYGAIMLLAKA